MKNNRVIVVGGGAAGLMAAGQAATLGADVLILEKMKQPGRKLRITGKGRCNLTNSAEVSEFLKHFPAGSRFLRQAFARFFAPDLITFFKKLGVRIELERGGRYFPEGNRAEDIVDALLEWVGNLGIKIFRESPVKKLIIKDNRIIGVRTLDREFKAGKIILAVGGASYPSTGSTGDGYRLAQSAGHTIIPPRPSLVPIETAGSTAQRLQGLSLKNVDAKLIIDGKIKTKLFGEMLFTHYGLSGPIILSLSRQIVGALNEKHEVTISIDLKPALDDKKLDARLLRDFEKLGKRKFKTILKGLLPEKLITVCAGLTKISPDKKGNSITADERKRLRLWLKDFRFEVSGHRNFKEAIITAGGISAKEINPRTLQSRLVNGLYMAGEILDIDADTGGYNLQAAFSTGYLAGQAAAQE